MCGDWKIGTVLGGANEANENVGIGKLEIERAMMVGGISQL
jgi:hypothetical protein